jgi:hypothetical protein
MIEFAALLLVSTLFGGMMLYSFGFAPMVFSALPAEDAGRFIRAAFPWYYLFVIATAGLGGAILLSSNPRSGAFALAIAVIGICPRGADALDQHRARHATAGKRRSQETIQPSSRDFGCSQFRPADCRGLCALSVSVRLSIAQRSQRVG